MRGALGARGESGVGDGAPRLRLTVTLAGEAPDCVLFEQALVTAGVRYKHLDVDWLIGAEQSIDEIAGLETGDLIVCPWPETPEHWYAIDAWRAAWPERVVTSQELLPFYTGRDLLGPLADLDRLCPLARASESSSLGPTRLSNSRFGEPGNKPRYLRRGACGERAQDAHRQVRVRLARGHRNDGRLPQRERRELRPLRPAVRARCHYHSFAPFRLFENLISLSDRVFLGGYIATEDFPDEDYQELEHDGRAYRVKPHNDGFGGNQGLHLFAYNFVAEDLTRFFEERGFTIDVLPAEEQTPGQPPNRYFRFLATKA